MRRERALQLHTGFQFFFSRQTKGALSNELVRGAGMIAAAQMMRRCDTLYDCCAALPSGVPKALTLSVGMIVVFIQCRPPAKT